RRWGTLSSDECARAVAKYVTAELRETDLVVRSGSDEFIVVSPRLSRDQAETLKSRLQDGLDHFGFVIRNDTQIHIPASIGIASFPEDGTDLQLLTSVAEWRLREDQELRKTVQQHTRRVKS